MGEEEDGEAGTFVDIITRTGGTPYLIIANTAMIYALSHGHSNYKERKVANPPQADLNIWSGWWSDVWCSTKTIF